MQCVFFEQVYAVYNGVWSKAPEAGEFFSRIFVLKVTLQSLLTVSDRKIGEQDVLLLDSDRQ